MNFSEAKQIIINTHSIEQREAIATILRSVADTLPDSVRMNSDGDDCYSDNPAAVAFKRLANEICEMAQCHSCSCTVPRETLDCSEGYYSGYCRACSRNP